MHWTNTPPFPLVRISTVYVYRLVAEWKGKKGVDPRQFAGRRELYPYDDFGMKMID